MAEATPRPGIGAAVAAANERARKSLLRNHGGGHAPVSNLELFFDLVYVFAITQVSHFIHHHLGLLGLFEGLLLFLAVWWAWIYTTWVANWANPDRMPIRLLLLGVMLLSLAMAVALPKAFEGKALAFAASYVVLQLGRSALTALAFKLEGAPNARNMARIAIWFVFSAPFWFGGALLGGAAQLALWSLALAIEFAGPFALFRVPGLGHSRLSDWDISGSHMAERCALFIIIALGEGIIVTGSAFASLAMEPGLIAAFVIAFLGSVLMWWLYFDIGMVRGARMIAGHAQVGRLARNAYTYLHMPIVLGIIVVAVGDALLLEQWGGPVSTAFVAAQVGGALLFIFGVGMFKRFASAFGNFPFSHLIAAVQFALLGLWGLALRPQSTTFALMLVVVLFVTSLWEWVSYHGGWVERMEARGWRLGIWLQARTEQRRAARLARESGQPVD
ncbi:MAG: low temperature requirement protein A [Novosphingobium sp.]